MSKRKINHTVYAIRNKMNNKSYIGWTTNFIDRKSRHLRCAKKGTNTRLYDAIRRYGKENFEWIILFDNLGGVEDCLMMEQRMIFLFDTFNNGYNGTKGGTGGNTFNGINNSGVFTKGHISWHKGEKMSQKYCKIMSEAHIADRKLVKQMTIDGELIVVWESVIGASEFLGIQKANISAAALGKVKSAGGFKWEYYNKN